MPKVANSNVYGARWAIEHDADERENLGWENLRWIRGQAGPLRVFKSRGKGERKEEGTLDRPHPLSLLV